MSYFFNFCTGLPPNFQPLLIKIAISGSYPIIQQPVSYKLCYKEMDRFIGKDLIQKEGFYDYNLGSRNRVKYTI